MSRKSLLTLEDPLLTREDVSEILGLAPRTIDNLVTKRFFPRPISIGRRGCRRWRKSTIVAFLDQREQKARETESTGG